MKLFRRLSALVMALVLVLSLSIGVLAADFDNMTDGFNYDGEDTEVNINLTADDWWGNYNGKLDKTYNISSDNDSSLYFSTLGSGGTVNIDGSVVKEGLYTTDWVDVTINGDVDAGLELFDQSSLTVNGDVSYGVSAYEQSEVTLNGNVETCLYANGQAEVTVNGDANCTVDTYDYAEITVNGDVDGAVSAGWESEITVNGDVNGTVYASWQTEVAVNGDVNGRDGDPNDEEGYSYGYSGIIANGEAIVTVTGNVTGGDAYGDYVTAGNGIEATDGVTVTVGGNVSGGSTNGAESETGSGISVTSYNDYFGSATITVGGTVTGGKAENGADADGIYIELVEGAPAPSITVSGYDSASGVVGVFVEVPDDVEGSIEEYVANRDLTQDELDEIITIKSSEDSSAGTAVPYYGASFHYSRGQLINEHGVSVRALFAFGGDWEETVENGTVTITSAEEKGEVVVTVDSLKVMMDVGIETILFNGTKLVLKDAVSERAAYDTYTISAGAILLNGAVI